MTGEFYIGWQDQAPPSIGRFVRSRVLLVLAIAAIAACALTIAQPDFATSRFEFGTSRSFEGTVRMVPYPTLVVDRPGSSRENQGQSTWLLTVFGKEGADSEVGPLDGHRVRLDGTLIYRDGVTMVEIATGSVEDLGPLAQPSLANAPVGESAGVSAGESVVLRGEIVDAKCFLGVMKPGNLKAHRACATRCISGGVPPVLLVRDAEGRASYYLLVDTEGRVVNARIMDMIAEPIEVMGRVAMVGDLALLYADPKEYRRLSAAELVR